MAPNRRQISWLNTHEIRFPKYAAYYAFAEDTCKKNLQPRKPHEDKGVAVIFSTRSLKSLARKIFQRRCLAEIRAYTTTLVRGLAEVACRYCPRTRMAPGEQGLVAALSPGLAGWRGRRFRHMQRNLQRAHLLGHRVENTHPKKYLPGRQIDLLEKLELLLL